MAIDRNTRYPGRFDATTAARPQGAFKNRSSPGAKDGSYLERDWANDWDGFFGSLLRSAGLTPNGTPDTALASQYFDALRSLGLRQATESVTGVSKFSTLLMSLAGTDDTTSMTPAKVMAALSAFLPKRSFIGNDYIRIPDVPGGLIIQFGSAPLVADGNITTPLPIAFPNFALVAFVTLNNITFNTGSDGAVGAAFPTKSTLTIRSGVATSSSAFWLAIGY